MFEQRTTKHFDSACSRFVAAHVVADVARAAGMDIQVLRNKLNPAQPHQLTAGELVAIYHATGDDTLFDGLLLECGLTAVKVRAADMDGRPVTQRALDTTAHVAGLAAQTSTVLSKGRVTKRQRNALVGGLMAGVEQLMLLATEVEEKYHTVPGAAIAADIIRAGFGA